MIINPKGMSIGNDIMWPNIGHLSLGESKSIHLITRIGDNAIGRLINRVSVTGTPFRKDTMSPN